MRSGDQQQSSSTRQKLEEFELDLAKAVCQVDHLRSQNDVLELTLDDAKTTSEKLSMQLARHESNATAMQLALAYADQVSNCHFQFSKSVLNLLFGDACTCTCTPVMNIQILTD